MSGIENITSEESNFVRWAREEIERAGLFDEDSDYDGMLGDELMRMVETFDSAGHSGFSAMMAASIFQRLAQWKPLTPITNDPTEWMAISEEMGMDNCWQNRRQSSCFSTDGGKTYYDIDEDQGRFRRFMLRRTSGWTWARHHEAVPANG